MLIMIICSNLVAIVDLKSTNTRSVTDKKSKKVRKHGEVCYHSVPHWEEKNGNFPCAKGLICRPPAKAKSPKGKPVPYKCFKDNRKNRSKGNIHFNSKKSRADAESTLFTISYKMPKISGRESEEGDIAQLNEDCAKPIPNYKARNCVYGTTCKTKPEHMNQSGSTSYCLPDEAKENETCYQSTRNYVPRTCVAGLECRFTTSDLASGQTGISKKCLKPKQLGKKDEQCTSMRGTVLLTCAAGLACLEKPVVPGVKTLNMGKATKYCLTDPTVGYENDVCSRSTPGFQKKNCITGLVCRQKEEYLNETGHASLCLKPIVPLGLNEICKTFTKGAIAKQCDTRYECKKKAADANEISAPHYCLPTSKVPVPAGGKCNSGSSSSPNKNCAVGYSCRIKPEDVKGTNQTGVASYCLAEYVNKQTIRLGGDSSSLPPMYISEGDICSRPVSTSIRFECRSGLECKPTAEDVKLGKTGVSSICQKKATAANEVSIAGEGQICAKSTPGFESKQCTAGTVCKPTSMQSGVSSVCTKPTSTNTNVVPRLLIGETCSTGGAKECPSGHSCKPAFNSLTASKTYCLLPSAFDQPGYKPFVGLNNYCNNTKLCTSGSTCTPVYDGSKVCIAKNYSELLRP